LQLIQNKILAYSASKHSDTIQGTWLKLKCKTKAFADPKQQQFKKFKNKIPKEKYGQILTTTQVQPCHTRIWALESRPSNLLLNSFL
jgi:hypothetical protein